MIVFISHPIQYVTPLLIELARKTSVIVYYYSGASELHFDEGFGHNVRWDIPLLEGYSSIFLNKSSNTLSMNTKLFDAVNFKVFSIIGRTHEKIILLNGWSYLTDWFVLVAAKLFGKEVWIRSEMPWNQELMKDKSLFRTVKFYFFKHFVFKFFVDKFLYIGTQNKKYYQMYGVNDKRLIFTPYSVDNDRFQNIQQNPSEARRKWGIDVDSVVVLYSGKLINKKRPLDLLKAFQQLDSANVVLFYMGDGPLKFEIIDYVEKYSIANVIISGFINQSEVSAIYNMADLFVMCSGIGETWGLSVNEAMNFSLPILISRTCGSSFDLVEDGLNGYIFPEGNILELSRRILELVNDKQLRNDMGQISLEKIQKFSHQISSTNMLATVCSLD